MKTIDRLNEIRWGRLKPTPKQLPIGIDEYGEPVPLGLLETNALIAGQPGAGKSGTFASIYAQLAQLPNVATINFDPKMVELGAWADRSSFNSVGECCFPLVLEALYQEMERRYVILKHLGLKKFTPEHWQEFPQLVLVMDELAKVFSDPTNLATPAQKTINYTFTRKLIAEGRAAGISVYVATQRPSADLVPTSMRNLIQQRIAHSLARESDTRMVLGDIDGTKAHELNPSQKGVGYILTEGSRTPTLFRASLVLNNAERETLYTSGNKSLREIAENYPTIEEIVNATKHLRVPLPFLDSNYELQEHLEEHRKDEAVKLARLGLA